MTEKEMEAMNHLVRFWNSFLNLPDVTDPDSEAQAMREVMNAVHVIQGVLAIRVARRVNPELWRS